MNIDLRLGSALEVLKTLAPKSIQCVVTSPPYWGLRDYGVEGQLGLEKTPEEYVAKLLEIFLEIWRVLRDDGTVWLNLGDSYARQAGDDSLKESDTGMKTGRTGKSAKLFKAGTNRPPKGYKAKDLIGIPWTVALALRAQGWYLRRDIIWAKNNPMPESTKDRPTTSHEYLFLLSKSERYYYDQEAVKEPVTGNAKHRGNGTGPKTIPRVAGWAQGDETEHTGPAHNRTRVKQNSSFSKSVVALVWDRNLRSVWEIEEDEFAQFLEWKRSHEGQLPSVWNVSTTPFKEAHFATFPPKLVTPCILAGSSERACEICGAPFTRQLEKKTLERHELDPSDSRYRPKRYAGKYADATALNGREKGVGQRYHQVTTKGWEATCDCECSGTGASVVMDPFSGASTTGLVANRLGRNFLGIELKAEYLEMSRERLFKEAPLFAVDSNPEGE